MQRLCSKSSDHQKNLSKLDQLYGLSEGLKVSWLEIIKHFFDLLRCLQQIKSFKAALLPQQTNAVGKNECHFETWWRTIKILLLWEFPLVLFDFDSFNIYFLISDILLIDVAQLPQISLFKL